MIRIKRRLSGASGGPASLGSGQLAWNSVDGTLYIGDGDNGSGTATSVKPIASASFATQSYVDGKISALVNGAGAALDTLQELSAALGNDPNFAATVTGQINGKLSSSAVSSFMLGVIDKTDAASVRAAIGAQAALGYTPIQQGGGAGQGGNKVYIGWAADAGVNKLLLQVGTTDFGQTWPISVSGNAATATTATNATNASKAADSDKLAGATPSAFAVARLAETTAAAWRTGLGLGSAATLSAGAAANNLVQLDANAKLPAVDGSQLAGNARGYRTVSTADPSGGSDGDIWLKV